MMKKRFLFCLSLAFSLVALLPSCSNEDGLESEEAIAKSGMTITTECVRNYITDESPITRATLERGTNGLDFKWSKGDIVGLFEQTGTQQTLMKMVSGEGTGTARFSAETFQLTPGQRLKAVYPTKLTTDSHIPVSWEGQTQTGNNNWQHLVNYDYMVSDLTTPTAENSADFKLHHVGAILRVSAFVPDSATYNAVTLTTDDSIFTTEAILDIFGDTLVVPTKRSNSITLHLDCVRTTGDFQKVSAWLMLVPVDLSDKRITVT